jgi:hypothetical protein
VKTVFPEKKWPEAMFVDGCGEENEGHGSTGAGTDYTQLGRFLQVLIPPCRGNTSGSAFPGFHTSGLLQRLCILHERVSKARSFLYVLAQSGQLLGRESKWW